MITLYPCIISLGLIFAWASQRLIRLLTAKRIDHIRQLRGPPPTSWLVGSLPELLRPGEVGVAETAWTKAYGTAVHIRGSFGRHILFLSDPLAIQHIFNTHYERYVKSLEQQVQSLVIVGDGIFAAVGDKHSRQRKIMAPAFSRLAVQDHIPMFRDKVKILISKWQDLLSQNDGRPMTVNVQPWLTRLTLDVFGGALDYDIGELDGHKRNELGQSYQGLFASVAHNPSDFQIAVQDIFSNFPFWMVPYLRSANKTVQHHYDTVRKVSRSLVERQTRYSASEISGRRDIMALLVKENQSSSAADRMTDEEVLDQLGGLLLAAHETSAATLTWTLYELSRHRKIQQQLRDEIQSFSDLEARLSGELTMKDYDSMPVLLAVLKETLRLYPILIGMGRQAIYDDVIPLSFPLRTKGGDIITQLPITKGQQIYVSTPAYNRLPQIWGDDADVWNPDRFLNNRVKAGGSSLGMVSNLLTFSSGERGCIGWRFGMLELQVALYELLKNFEFSPPPGDIKIIGTAAILLTPMIKGEKDSQGQMPLTISALP